MRSTDWKSSLSLFGQDSFFFRTLTLSQSMTAQNKYMANIYAILTSCLVNNPYILHAGLEYYHLWPEQEKKVFFPCNTSFSEKSCSVKIAGYWPRSFFRFNRTSLRLSR